MWSVCAEQRAACHSSVETRERRDPDVRQEKGGGEAGESYGKYTDLVDSLDLV